MGNSVYISKISNYDKDLIYDSLPDTLFSIIGPMDTVVLKPNWVKESHLYRPDDWDYVITHPDVITSVLKKVASKLQPGGKVIIADGPQTDSSFEKIISHYPLGEWYEIAGNRGIDLQIIDLRDDEWINEGDVTVVRKRLPGDPKGSTEVNLINDLSEFYNHTISRRGYYGADYDIKETNKAHDGHNNIYRVSRSVIEADVFINLPKLKTHKKAGITCCLKNLVGINTYKNYLPHYSEGGPDDKGDQFPVSNAKTVLEGSLMAFIKQYLIGNTFFARLFKPIKKKGKIIFGDTNHIIRSGNWYGNDTVWRMILDLNKILLYANPDGTLREDTLINSKKYIGIVDGILSGEGNGPMAPDPVNMNLLICGSDPVSIDAVSSVLMGFDCNKIPVIDRAYRIKKYKISAANTEQIKIRFNDNAYTLDSIPKDIIVKMRPHFGWTNHIEVKK